MNRLLNNNQTSSGSVGANNAASLASNAYQLAGVKRPVTQAAINDSSRMSKQRKFMKDMMQESNGSHFWSIPSADNFVNTKTTVISANQTPLTNGDIEFSVRSSDKYTHVNTIEFHLNVVLQKLEGGVWKNVPDADPVVVLPGAVMNLLREHLEVKMVHPGEAEDTSVINIKQDERRYLSRNEIQRSYDKLYCEKELSDDMQIIKELTYPYEFATTGTV